MKVDVEKGIISDKVELLVKSRRINEGYDWVHVSFLINEDTVAYT